MSALTELADDAQEERERQSAIYLAQESLSSLQSTGTLTKNENQLIAILEAFLRCLPSTEGRFDVAVSINSVRNVGEVYTYADHLRTAVLVTSE